MLNINATNFRSNMFEMLEQTIKYNEPINISTKNGNAIVISESDYNNIMETLMLCSVPGLKETLLEGMQTPVEECVPEEEVDW